MASRKSLVSLAALMRVTKSPPAAILKTIVPSIAGCTSPTVFRRMFSVPKKGLEMVKEIDKQQMKMEKEKKIKELYNTSQRILIGCVGDLSFAHDIATTLGDGSNITVMCQTSCDEMKRLHANTRAHMLELTYLGATMVFDVDFTNYKEDSRVNQMRYDRILLDLPEK